jgi:4-carboxymuconolactone decarboxylase
MQRAALSIAHAVAERVGCETRSAPVERSRATGWEVRGRASGSRARNNKRSQHIARVPYVSREYLPPEAQKAWDDFAAPRKGRVENNPRVIANSPDAAVNIWRLATYLRFESDIPPKAFSLATITTAAEHDSDYVLAWHIPSAVEKGVSQAAIDAVRQKKLLDGVPDDEALVIRYAREVVRCQVSDETFQAAVSRFGVKTLLDLTLAIGQYTLLHYVASAFEVERDAGWKPLLC